MPLRHRTTLTQYLIEERRRFPNSKGNFNALILDVALACKAIARAVAMGELGGLYGDHAAEAGGAINVQGETQKKLDVLSNDLFIRMNEWGGHLAGMASEGMAYRGVLYAGLMLTPSGPKLVEYNARFGDPECQVLMLRLESDLVPYLMATAKGTLDQVPAPKWHDGAAICVVLAAPGYPDAPITGSVIGGLDQDFGQGVAIFHAGTTQGADGKICASGGRVINVCARGYDLAEARMRAYGAIAKIDWSEGFHRTDIGWRGL